MVWTTPVPWQPGTTTTAAQMNLRIRDNLNHLAADSGWITPALGASWVDYSATFHSPGYRKIGQIVQLRGAAKNGTLGTVIFTLPVGMRPLKRRIFLGVSAGNGVRIDVLAGGAVSVVSYNTGGSNALITFDTIRFIAEA